MTNKEKYKQAFSTMHISDEFSVEVKKMISTNKKTKLNRMVASIAACILIVGSSTVAYAADLGGIQRILQLWIHGEQTNVTIQFDGNGNYDMNYIDEEGNSTSQSGGGVAIDVLGNERPLTEEEIMEQIMAPEVLYEEDGSVWVYWLDQKIDITDKFENDICYVKLENGDETLYMTVRYNNGYSTSPHKYITP